MGSIRGSGFLLPFPQFPQTLKCTARAFSELLTVKLTLQTALISFLVKKWISIFYWKALGVRPQLRKLENSFRNTMLMSPGSPKPSFHLRKTNSSTVSQPTVIIEWPVKAVIVISFIICHIQNLAGRKSCRRQHETSKTPTSGNSKLQWCQSVLPENKTDTISLQICSVPLLL